MKQITEIDVGDFSAADLTRISEVRLLVERLGFHPSRALGQNFLIDRNILNILIDAANISSEDRVLEVGPGLGVVTESLLSKAKSLIAVEKDHRLYDWLSGRLAGRKSLELIEGDVLKVGIPGLLSRGIDKFVSNLPYSPGSRILLDVVRDENAPDEIVVTVQLEVGQRITADPGSKTFGLMALWCQLHYEVQLVKVISPNCFWPRPDIKSAIVRLKRRKKSLLDKPEEEYFYDLTRYAFQHRRKQLVSTLSKASGALQVDADICRKVLEELGIKESARPEEIGVALWCELSSRLRGSARRKS